jgi:uncharacterized protein (UPF0332 family)
MSDIEEAEILIESARFAVERGSGSRAHHTVAMSLSIHSMIKANDALTMRFLKQRSTRHEQAPTLFKELVVQGKIPAKYVKFRNILATAIAHKSDYDYKGKEASSKEANDRIREAEDFVAALKEILGLAK